MYIKSLKLEKFKSYCDVTIVFDKHFNVIIGENNIGKSTIFEALQLWKKCFDMSIAANGNKFYSEKTTLYINFEELHFIRLSCDEDIFFSGNSSCKLTVIFSTDLSKDDEEQDFVLSFVLTKPIIKNAYVRFTRENEVEFQKLSQYLRTKNTKLNQFIFIHQTAPVSNILSKEPYMYKGQILKKIQKGKSDEVLRNKIIQSLDSGGHLEDWMKNVLDIQFRFIPPKRVDREKNEYIKLLVDKNGERLDIFLQGSGFLQTAEIFSTIEIMDNALNILLIDEPDSHISPRIQSRLVECLKNIEETQTFIISHNDNFVSDVEPNHILFINDSNKQNGLVKSLEVNSVDTLHMALGGIVTGLTKLQRYKTVCFVEGTDDIFYLQRLIAKLKEIGSAYYFDFHKISFWYIRGKDYLPQKILTGKQLISQAINHCKFATIFDKDFSTVSANRLFVDETVRRRLGTDSTVHTHNGYCIESVLFSDKERLNIYLNKLLPYAQSHQIEGMTIDSDFNISEFIEEFYERKSVEICNCSSELYIDMKNKFTSQKKPQRPELESVEFDEFAAESKDNIQFAMNKKNITDFVQSLERSIGGYLFHRDDESEESVSSQMLIKYIDTIENDADIFLDYIELINKLNSCL